MATREPLLPSPEADSRRLEDLFQYLPSYADEALFRHNPIDSAEYDPTRAKLSVDPVLTALAQLAAFRTGAERAFISLIDDHHQIVVAEATVSISLTNEKEHAYGDGLCIGSTILDLTSGICASTMDAFTGNYSHSPFIDDGNAWADRSRYWIGDLSLTSRFGTRPYVKEFPYMRFYAEVPITTPSGFVIGSLAVVDPVPRSSLSETHFNALKEIASALMRHLTLLRSEKSHQRTARKLSNLDHFVSCGEAAVENIRPSPITQVQKDGSVVERFAQPMIDPGRSRIEPAPFSPSDGALQGDSSMAWEASQQDHIRDRARINEQASRAKKPAAEALPERSMPTSSTMTELRGILSQGAQYLLNSIDLDFVSFYEPNPNKPLSEISQGEDDVGTNILASVTSYRMASPAEALPSTITKELHDLFPDGCHLSFVLNQSYSTHSLEATPASFDDRRSQSAVRELQVKLAISKLYPDLQAAIFLPFWSESRQSWVANAFAGTMAPRRVLEKADLSYFTLFRSCILTCISKMDLILHDRAKIGFISSISHELRSPIHGILGNTELVYDVEMASSQLECVRAIEQCSQTLLDTVDHILDYAKISTSNAIEGGKITSYGERRSGPSTSFQLDSLLEDTIATTVEGYRYMRKAKSSLDHRNLVGYGLAVHGTPTAHSSEAFQDHAVAVCFDAIDVTGWEIESHISTWRRIILNLVGNALKYTSKGLISISLALRSRDPSLQSTSSPEREAVLIVKDTGKGISSKFLKHHLFQPFQQENGLNQGTGLGLSIVKRLVEDLSGEISVQSETSVGSEFRLFIPVITSAKTSPEKQRSHLFRKIRFAGFDDPRQALMEGNSRAGYERTKALKDLVDKCFAAFYDIEDSGYSDSEHPATLIVYTASQYLAGRDGRSGTDQRGITPALVLSDSLDDQYYSSKKDFAVEEYVAQPLSGLRIAAAIDRLLEKTNTVQRSHGDVDSKVRMNEFVRMAPPSSSGDHRPQCVRVAKLSEGNPSMARTSIVSPLQSSHPSVAQIGLDSNKPTFLLVDDNEINLSLLKRLLTKLGCNHMSAYNGQQAVDIFKTAPCAFKAVFMDLSMPVLDGFDASRMIREVERSEGRKPATTIIALTGLSDANALQQAMQCGVNIFMTKPVSLKKVKELVENDTAITS